MKLVRLSKMCLHETYSKVHIGKYLSDSFAIQNGAKTKFFITPDFIFTSEYAIRKTQENFGTEIECYTSASGLC
jgi:hypothetical protein